MNRFLALAALLASLSITSRTSAAEASPDKLIEEGLHLRRDGRPAEALELFRQAHAIAPSPRTFGQMGLVEASLRQWVDAENHLSVSLANPDDAWVRKNRAFLDEALSLCQRHVGDLVVSGTAGAEVFVGGRLVGTLPAVPALRLAEGTVTVTASAPGFQPFERTVTVQAGSRTPLAIALVPVVAAPTGRAVAPPPAPAPALAASPPPAAVAAPATPAEQPKASRWHTWTGLGVAAVGAAALGWGITWIVIDGGCPHGEVCMDPGKTSGNYETRTPGWILVGAGTAALVGGVVILLTGHSDSGFESRARPDAKLAASRDQVLTESALGRPRRPEPKPPAAPGYAFAFSVGALVAAPIAIFFGCTSGFFGTLKVSTPFFRSALTFSASMPSGSVNERVKLP